MRVSTGTHIFGGFCRAALIKAETAQKGHVTRQEGVTCAGRGGTIGEINCALSAERETGGEKVREPKRGIGETAQFYLATGHHLG